jgi:hypothetical protein
MLAACATSPDLVNVQLASRGHYYVHALGCFLPIPSSLALNTREQSYFAFIDPEFPGREGGIFRVEIRPFSQANAPAGWSKGAERKAGPLSLVQRESPDGFALVVVHDGQQQLAVVNPPAEYPDFVVRECLRSRENPEGTP